MRPAVKDDRRDRSPGCRSRRVSRRSSSRATSGRGRCASGAGAGRGPGRETARRGSRALTFVAFERTRETHALALAAAARRPPLSPRRVSSALRRAATGVSSAAVDRPRQGARWAVRCVGVAVVHVVVQRAVPQPHAWVHPCGLRSQLLVVRLAALGCVSVDGVRGRRWVTAQSSSSAQAGGLAGARRADEGDVLSRARSSA